MLKEKISVKYLIHLVNERPALWDRTSESYRDRSLKEVSWHEICTSINENYEHMSPEMRQEFSKMVSKKWTHIRDCWVKSMKNGYDDKTMKPAKPYIYHDELHFLQKMLKCQRRLKLLAKMDESEFDSLFDDTNTKFQLSNHHSAANENANDNANDGEILQTNENCKNNEEPKVVIEENSDFHTDVNDDDDDWPVRNENSIIDIKEESIHEEQPEKPEPIFKTRDYFKHGVKMKHNKDHGISRRPSVQINPITTTNNSNCVSSDNSNTVTTTTTAATVSNNNWRPYGGNKIYQGMKRKLTIQPAKSDNFHIKNIKMQENRHWNFFKGILPSVNHLNDMQTLEFQAGVINLLQKLRSQPISQTNRMNGQTNEQTIVNKNSKLPEECWNFERTASNVQLSTRQHHQQQQQQQKRKRKQQQQRYSTRSHQRNKQGVDPLGNASLDLTDSNGGTILDNGGDIFI